MYGQAAAVTQRDQMRRGHGHQAVVAQKEIAQLHHARAQPVAARGRVLDQVPQAFPGMNEALRGAFPQPGQGGDVGQPQ
ncbi:hypothetical protein D3C73_1500960 [compost metagenome]